MAEKENYNLKQVFTHPITIYKFGRYTLPFGVPLVRLVVSLVIFLIMLIFHKLFMTIGSMVSGLWIILYTGIPYFLGGYLVQKTYDGKKIAYYLYDFSNYFFGVYLPKKRYCNDEVVEYMDEKEIRIEPIYIETEKVINEVKERPNRRIPQKGE